MRAHRLYIKLGVPEHGWLPVVISESGFELEIDASDVPVNPIELLCHALIEVLNGSKAEVYWNLEPSSYLFIFKPDGNEYQLKIQFKDFQVESTTLLHETKGDFERLILPFYRAIKLFLSNGYKEPHWPELDENLVLKLNKSIKNAKRV